MTNDELTTVNKMNVVFTQIVRNMQLIVNQTSGRDKAFFQDQKDSLEILQSAFNRLVYEMDKSNRIMSLPEYQTPKPTDGNN